jgi:CheY-like chemotaxis protein
MPSEHGTSPGRQSGIITYADPATTVLADADDLFRENAQQLLTEDGYAVTEAADGGEALELLSEMANAHLPLPEVLVMDFVMPRLSGLGVLRALWHVRRLPPTLLLSDFPDPSVDTIAKRLGVYRVLRKPADGEDLCAAFREVSTWPAKRRRGSRDPRTD